MSQRRSLAVVLFVVAVGLVVAGIYASPSAAHRWRDFFAGHRSGVSEWYFAGGAFATIVGMVLLMLGSQRMHLVSPRLR